MLNVSVIVPVYMEAENIRGAISSVLRALNEAKIECYEILIIDCKRQDGTDDGTPAIADELALINNRIKVFHNSYINLGHKYWMGVDNAKYPYLVMVPGDNEISTESIAGVLRHTGEADLIISYSANMEIRPLFRRCISHTYTFLMNAIAGLHLRYFNGICVHRTELLRRLQYRNDSFAYMAEILIQLLKQGHSYKEVPLMLQLRQGKSSAFKKDNVISISKTFVKLFLRYRLGVDN